MQNACISPLWQHLHFAPDIVSLLIEDGVLKGASDVHIDPESTEQVLVRCRMDGIMTCVGAYKKSIHPEVLGRIKILSSLRIDIHDHSQDNAFVFTSLHARVFDVRVSIAPTIFGENIVLRLIERTTLQKERCLDDLLLSNQDEIRIKKALALGHGMIIIAGPTGSGKTSTLYAMIHELSLLASDRLIVTIEDPVERSFKGVRQIQIQHDKGFTFYTALRGILRQDPDVLMVGEMRDTETAKAAIQCALSGHLLLTTIHAKDAASIVPRLIDMGIDPYMIASTATLLMSQRLVRKASFDDVISYKGRVATFEVIAVSDAFRQAILQKCSREALWKIAEKEGAQSLLEDGLEKVCKGLTTTDEIYRVLAE